MRVRYVGPLDVAELAIPGACLTFPRGQWVDPEQASLDAFVPAVHVAVVVRGLNPDQWDVDLAPAPKPKAAKAEASKTPEPPQEAAK